MICATRSDVLTAKVPLWQSLALLLIRVACSGRLHIHHRGQEGNDRWQLVHNAQQRLHELVMNSQNGDVDLICRCPCFVSHENTTSPCHNHNLTHPNLHAHSDVRLSVIPGGQHSTDDREPVFESKQDYPRYIGDSRGLLVPMVVCVVLFLICQMLCLNRSLCF